MRLKKAYGTMSDESGNRFNIFRSQVKKQYIYFYLCLELSVDLMFAEILFS